MKIEISPRALGKKYAMNKEVMTKLKTYIFKSSLIIIFPNKCIVQFIGNELERCEFKLTIYIIENIIALCNTLNIDYKIYL